MGIQKDYSPVLDDISKQYITREIAPIKRIVVTAANKLGDTGVILVGSRHWDKLMHSQMDAMSMSQPKASEIEQGFIDQYGQFLTRKEAYYIAHHNFQPLIGEDWGELFSENLH